MTFSIRSVRRYVSLIRPPAGLERWLVLTVPPAFGICVVLALVASQTSTLITAIWPANGVLLAALLLARKRRSKVLMTVGCYTLNVAADHMLGSHTITTSCAFSLVNVVEATLAAHALTRAKVQRLDFLDTRSVALFISITALCTAPTSVVAALIASAAYGANFVAAAETWFMADVLGLLVITPAVVLAVRPSDTPDVSKALPLSILFVLVAGIVFTQNKAPLLFLMMPIAGAIAFQLGPRATAFTTLILTVISVISTFANSGPASLMPDGNARIWVMQIFCLVNHFMCFFVAAAIAERDSLRLQSERLAKAERLSKRRLDAALDAMKQGLCLFDADERVVARNDCFLSMYRLPSEAVMPGTTFAELRCLCQAAGTEPEAGDVGTLSFGDRVQQLADGRRIRISEQRLQDGSVVCTYLDVTAEKKAEEALRHASLHDALTGLPNRRYFTESIRAALDRNAAVCLYLIDVDHFKTINDTLGHAAGDQVLRTIAARLLSCVREGDEVARIGGDEFAVLAFRLNDPQSVEQVGQRILDAMRDPVTIDGQLVAASLSIGAGRRTEDMDTLSLFKFVDSALYEAKAKGRNCLSVAQANASADAVAA